MKGVTMEENRRRVAALKAILERAENRQCADCQASGGAGRPSWASINTGVFICMRCAGIHRGLGVHISKVPLAPLSPSLLQLTQGFSGPPCLASWDKGRLCFCSAVLIVKPPDDRPSFVLLSQLWV